MMRKFDRLPVPEVLQIHGETWTSQWLELRQNNPSAGFSWYSVGGRTAREYLLPHLSTQTDEHCSFCDAFPLWGTSRETIEHFQPKSAYPKLAYAWHNLYYCCDRCQSFKLERWDDLLLRPDAPDYSCSRYFEFDTTTGEIKPNAASPPEDQARARRTIEFYGLDSQPRRRHRLYELRRLANTKKNKVHEEKWPYRDFLGLNTD